MSEITVGCIGLVLLLLLFMSGLELGFAMTIIGIAGFTYLRSFNAALNIFAKDFFGTFTSYAFTVIPLFVLMGQVAFNSGMAEKLYTTTRKFVGQVPGGLALATVVGATIFKSISGSTLATAATFSGVAIPEMDKYGYNRLLSTGVVASVGTIGMLIPPSGNLIIFAMITEQSIGKLFLAGIVPGLIIAFMFLLVVVGWCKVSPSIAPRGPRFEWKERLRGLPMVAWPLIIFIVVIGGLLVGFFTPTEAGAVGSIAVLALTIAKGDLNFKGIIKSVSESLRMACMVLFLIAGSQVLGHFIAMAKIPAAVASWTLGLGLNPLLVVVLIIFVYLIGGSFIDDIAFMILATPIFWPVVKGLGFDPIWFAMIIAVTLMIGVIVPPVAVGVFIVSSITKDSVWTVYKGVTPFLIALTLGLVLLFVFPGIATWLPSVLMK
jgi:C4-dicarboxylate transporter, DctM subunit